ncbi:MAG: CapA family protein [Candidatus Omnitrophica bacterium]|nr:CapA family protein [Candidatus Omnitrophota bacterium]
MLGRTIADRIKQHGSDYPFDHVRQTLQEADVLFGVLDAPVVTRAEPNPNKPKDFPFIKCEAGAVDGLKRIPFDVVHIGTNHILDFGEGGLLDTQAALQERQLKYIGAGRNLAQARQAQVIESRGKSIGFLGYCLSYPAEQDKAGCAPMRVRVILDDIKNLRGKVDWLVVSIHHGIEYCHYPYPEYRHLVHQAIDQGADIVLGHHPHVLQGFEHYHEGVVVYSLGNFVFDQDDKPEGGRDISSIRRFLEKEQAIALPGGERFYQSIILKLTLENKEIKLDFLPIKINTEGQPTLAAGKDKEEIQRFFTKISHGLDDPKTSFAQPLSELYAQENVQILFKYNLKYLFQKCYRIRWRHIRQVLLYLNAKLINRHSRRQG